MRFFFPRPNFQSLSLSSFSNFLFFLASLAPPSCLWSWQRIMAVGRSKKYCHWKKNTPRSKRERSFHWSAQVGPRSNRDRAFSTFKRRSSRQLIGLIFFSFFFSFLKFSFSQTQCSLLIFWCTIGIKFKGKINRPVSIVGYLHRIDRARNTLEGYSRMNHSFESKPFIYPVLEEESGSRTLPQLAKPRTVRKKGRKREREGTRNVWNADEMNRGAAEERKDRGKGGAFTTHFSHDRWHEKLCREATWPPFKRSNHDYVKFWSAILPPPPAKHTPSRRFSIGIWMGWRGEGGEGNAKIDDIEIYHHRVCVIQFFFFRFPLEWW